MRHCIPSKTQIENKKGSNTRKGLNVSLFLWFNVWVSCGKMFKIIKRISIRVYKLVSIPRTPQTIMKWRFSLLSSLWIILIKSCCEVTVNCKVIFKKTELPYRFLNTHNCQFINCVVKIFLIRNLQTSYLLQILWLTCMSSTLLALIHSCTDFTDDHVIVRRVGPGNLFNDEKSNIST